MKIFNDPLFDAQRNQLTPKRIREIIKVGRQHGQKIVVSRRWYNGLLTLLFPYEYHASNYIMAVRILQRLIHDTCACTECLSKEKFLIG